MRPPLGAVPYLAFPRTPHTPRPGPIIPPSTYECASCILPQRRLADSFNHFTSGYLPINKLPLYTALCHTATLDLSGALPQKRRKTRRLARPISTGGLCTDRRLTDNIFEGLNGASPLQSPHTSATCQSHLGRNRSHLASSRLFQLPSYCPAIPQIGTLPTIDASHLAIGVLVRKTLISIFGGTRIIRIMAVIWRNFYYLKAGVLSSPRFRMR